MRVIAGEHRGRRLFAPPGRSTRPTSDRVREAMFSMLESLGVLEGATVWDLFAGSGAMGIEALSRGAGRVTFVDQARPAVAATRANLGTLGYGPPRAVVVCAEALSWATAAVSAKAAAPSAWAADAGAAAEAAAPSAAATAGAAADAAGAAAGTGTGAAGTGAAGAAAGTGAAGTGAGGGRGWPGPDLVFADPPYAWDHWADLLGALVRCRPLVMMESGAGPALPPGWDVLRRKSYGGTVVTLTRFGAGDQP